MIFLGLLVMIIFFFWPVILGAIILFIIWMCWPEKKWECKCNRKFYREKSCKEHIEKCEINKRINQDRERAKRFRERQERERRERQEREWAREEEKRERQEREWAREEEKFRREERKFYEEWDRIFEELLNKLSTPDIGKYYKILDLKTNATLAQIKRRYRELVLKYHPDKCKDKKIAEKKFKKIVEAYEMIIRYRKENPEYEETVVERYPTKPTSNV